MKRDKGYTEEHTKLWMDSVKEESDKFIKPKVKGPFSFSEILARINWFVEKQECNNKN